MAGKIRTVLFVCTGNSCRSVMAEGLLKKYLKELGKDHVEVRSAGTSAVNGFSATKETIEVMKRELVDVSGFKSKRVNAELIKWADLILVMEWSHKDEIARILPEAASKTYLLREFGMPGTEHHPEGFSIPDPIGRPIQNYEYCIGVIKKEIERIARVL